MLQRISGIGVSRYDTSGGILVPVDSRPVIVTRPSPGTPVVPSLPNTGTPSGVVNDAGGGDGGSEKSTSGNTWLWVAVALAAGYFLYKNSKRKR